MAAPKPRHVLYACRSVGPAVEHWVLPPKSSVKRSSGGRFARSLDGTLLLAASCKLQHYANEGCKTCASLAGLFKLLSYLRQGL